MAKNNTSETTLKQLHSRSLSKGGEPDKAGPDKHNSLKPADDEGKYRSVIDEEDDEEGQRDSVPEVKKSLWTICCEEVAAEKSECTKLLLSADLLPFSYSRDKTFPRIPYEELEIRLPVRTPRAKDFLDFYIFPTLTPAIMAMIEHLRKEKVLQFKHHVFNPLDFLAEYLYNHNPLRNKKSKYKKHSKNHSHPPPYLPLQDIPFFKAHPRPLVPRWLLMSKDQAATIIQRYARGYIVRKRGDVQELRKFWKDLKNHDGTGSIEKSKVEPTSSKPKVQMNPLKAVVTIQRFARGYITRKNPRIAEFRKKRKSSKKKRSSSRSKSSQDKSGNEALLDYEEEDEDDDDDDPTFRKSRDSGDFIGYDLLKSTHSEVCKPCGEFKTFSSSMGNRNQSIQEEDNNLLGPTRSDISMSSSLKRVKSLHKGRSVVKIMDK